MMIEVKGHSQRANGPATRKAFIKQVERWYSSFAQRYPEDIFVQAINTGQLSETPRHPLQTPHIYFAVDASDGDTAAVQATTTVTSRLLRGMAETSLMWTDADASFRQSMLCADGPLLSVYQGLQASAAEANMPRSGVPATVLAVLCGYGEALKCLLDQGADVDAADRFGNTALHWATLTQQDDLQALLKERGADVTKRNLLHGTAADYVDTHEPVERGQIFFANDGHSLPMDNAAVYEGVGLRLKERSTLQPDTIFILALTACSPLFSKNLPTQLPVEELPVPTAAPLTLRHFDDLGWGLCSKEDLQPGTYIGSYVGDIVSNIESLIRSRHSEPMTYGYNLFDQGLHQATLRNTLTWVVDAASEGGIISRANSPHKQGYENIHPREGWRQGRPVADFYTINAVRAGEQLVWYYGKEYFKTKQPRPLETKDAIFWHPDKPPAEMTQVASHLARLEKSGKYVLSYIDMGTAKSVATLVGTLSRPGILTSLLLEAEQENKIPVLNAAFAHEAPPEVQRFLVDVICQHHYYDMYLQKKTRWDSPRVVLQQINYATMPNKFAKVLKKRCDSFEL